MKEKNQACHDRACDRGDENPYLCQHCIKGDSSNHAALKDLELKMAEVQNTFLTAPCSELIHMNLGPKFREDQRKTAVIVRDLYGLPLAGEGFRNHLADGMCHLGYHSCLADPDLWYKPMVRPEANFKYYSYVLLYVDHCLCICHNAEHELHKIDEFFKMKDGSIGDPDIHLGAKVKTNGTTKRGKGMGLELKQVHPRGCEELQKIFGTQHGWEKAHPKGTKSFYRS